MSRRERLLEIYDELQDAVSVKVKISHGEALNIVVADLVRKHKSNVESGREEYADLFEQVIRYYVGDNFKKLVSETK